MTTTTRHIPSAQLETASRPYPELFELVDAIVEVVDIARDTDRLKLALQPFGGSEMFDAELRLNGSFSCYDDECVCRWL